MDDVTRSVELVHRAQGGDEAALNQLFERYYERVRRIVRLRLGVHLRSAVDSGDILQDTFVAAVQDFSRFQMRDEGSLIHWLSKIAEHKILAAADYHGAKKRDRRREVRISSHGSRSSSDRPPVLATDSTAPLERLSEGEQAEIVDACIRELTEDYRELILLRDYAGASWETVAEITGRPSAAAARMMHARAIVELGKLVRARGGS